MTMSTDVPRQVPKRLTLIKVEIPNFAEVRYESHNA